MKTLNPINLLNELNKKCFFSFIGDYPKNPLKPTGLRFTIVQKADHLYPFLHDTMLYFFHNRLFLAWYNSSSGEIKGKTVIRGRYSDDFGQTWSEPFILLARGTKEKHHYVPVMFYEYHNQLYAQVTVMKKHDSPIGFILLKYEGETIWKELDFNTTPIIFNTNAKILADGNLASGGRMSPKLGKKPEIPCIAIAHASGNNLVWSYSNLLDTRNQDKIKLKYPETDFISVDQKIYAITRNDHGAPLSFYSDNNGLTWTSTGYVELPVKNSKMCCGTLSNGSKYLLYNEKVGTERNRLVIAISNLNENGFSKLFLIADGLKDQFNGGSSVHYPCAIEKDGNLYISSTLSHGMGKIRHAILFIVPITAL